MKKLVKISTVLMTAGLMGCLDPGDEILSESDQESGIIFTRIPHTDLGRGFSPDHANTSIRDIGGTNIYKLSPPSPQGDLTNLTATWTMGKSGSLFRYPGAAMDPELSKDNTKLLFSMREGTDVRNSKKFQIFELNLQTNELTQLTGILDEASSDENFTEGDNFDPAYLDDNAVDVVFTSTRSGIVDEYERRASPLLHVGRGRSESGFAGVTQISFNQSFDQNPIVHSSGKIYFCRWEHLGNPNKMPIFSINPDGTGLFVLYGNHSPVGNVSFLDMAQMRDGSLVSALMERGTDNAGGGIALLDITRSDASNDQLNYITPGGSPYDGKDDQWVFNTPRSMMHNGIEKVIVAGAQGVVFDDGNDIVGEVNYGIYVLDKSGGEPRLIFDDPGTTDYDPIPIEPVELKISIVGASLADGQRPLFQTSPFVPPELIDDENPTGYFFTTNVNLRGGSNLDRQMSDIQGKARYLRLLEAIPLPTDRDMRGAEIGNTNLEKQRVIGYGSIRDDGSFSVEVPANVSMHMQVLDENGMMLVNQITWVQVMPGERRVCTGCHNSHEEDRAIERHEVLETDIDPLGIVHNYVTGESYLSSFANAEKVTEHPAAVPDTLDFANRFYPDKQFTVQKVFDNNCTECHNGTNASGGLNLVWSPSLDKAGDNSELREPTHVYEMLHGEDMMGMSGDNDFWVTDDGASRSPFMWVMYHKNLHPTSDDKSYTMSPSFDHSTLWAKDENNVINPFLAENRDLLTLIEWIDGGTQYSNTTGYAEY